MKKPNLILILLIVLVLDIQNVNSSRILCAYATMSPSHYFVAEALMKGLAEKGHDVTVITSFPSEYSHPNYRQVSIGLPTSNVEEVLDKVKNAKGIFELFKTLPSVVDLNNSIIEIMLNDPNVLKIIKKETFDLFITEAVMELTLLGLGSHFKCPTIAVSSVAAMNSIHKQSGNPLALSYATNHFFGFPTPLTFKYRVLNILGYIFETIYFESIYYTKHAELYNKYFPSPQYPLFDEMLKNVSLYMVSSHYSQGKVRPYVPTIIEIGGIHIKDKPAPLPAGLQKFMDESTNGVIYFSLGSNLKSSKLPLPLLNDLSNAFGRMKVNVLWKFENGTLPNIPKNVRLEKWIPQDDILQHKNLKLFITHGGFGSITEARYHGVPLVLIPIFGDQHSNANKVENEGFGVQLKLSDLSGDLLYKVVNEVLTNPKYTNQAKYLSMLYRDRPNTAMETGIFWTEYVIRHRGAKHLQSNAIHLNFIQLYSLDVIGFLFLIVLIFGFCFYKLIRFLVKKLTVLVRKPKME